MDVTVSCRVEFQRKGGSRVDDTKDETGDTPSENETIITHTLANLPFPGEMFVQCIYLAQRSQTTTP